VKKFVDTTLRELEVTDLDEAVRVLSYSMRDNPVKVESLQLEREQCLSSTLNLMATEDKSKSISGLTCHFAFEPDRDGILQ
jgi:hypothetical protein